MSIDTQYKMLEAFERLSLPSNQESLERHSTALTGHINTLREENRRLEAMIAANGQAYQSLTNVFAAQKNAYFEQAVAMGLSTEALQSLENRIREIEVSVLGGSVPQQPNIVPLGSSTRDEVIQSLECNPS